MHYALVHGAYHGAWCWDQLRRELERGGITMADVTSILLTHIHLDHAGAAGTILRDNPRLRVFVHEKGAPHLIDPAKLVTSAGRLYGDAMDRLWGEILPVPVAAIVALTGGERIIVNAPDSIEAGQAVRVAAGKTE